MGISQRIGELLHERKHLINRQRAAFLQIGAQRLARHIIHHHIIVISIEIEIDDVDDVRVMQLAETARLTLESLDKALGAGQVIVQHLDGDLALDSWLHGSVHRGHASLPQVFNQLIFAERPAREFHSV